MKFDRCFGCMEKTEAYPCPCCGYDPEKAKPGEYALAPGKILNGQYLVGKVLGQGGFGITYIGWDLTLERKVAIKEYFPAGSAGRELHSGSIQWYANAQASSARSAGMEMFLKEARKMSRVSSIPQVVHVLDLFQENETAYIIMEFIQGQTLKARLSQTGPMDWEQTRLLFTPVIQAMEQVHQAGLVHRDLSPDNLMLQPDGSARILDLGAAKDLNLNSGASSMLVAKGGFSPIEQYIQRGGSGPWTDVYALAAAMYYTLTGKTPMPAVDRMERDAIAWDLPQLQALPPAVLRAMQHAMALRPEDRTRTMEQFSRELMGKSRGKTGRKLLAAGIAAVCAVGLGVLALTCQPAVQMPRETQVQAAAPTTLPTEALTQPLAQTAPTAAEADNRWQHNLLKATPIQPNSTRWEVYGSNIQKYQIISVTFLDSVGTAPAASWDVSQAGDRSVLAWFAGDGKQFNLFIGADGGVNGADACKGLFYDFENLRTVHFGGNFHTEQAEDFTGMFFACGALQEVDLETLDTSSAVNLTQMFSGCKNLPQIDLSQMDTSNVESMAWMFGYCENLRQIDVGSWDTARTVDMRSMFSGCRNLESLDLTGFDTSHVAWMDHMFKDCYQLTDLMLGDFNTQSVTDYTGFLPSGATVDGRPWKTLFEGN